MKILRIFWRGKQGSAATEFGRLAAPLLAQRRHKPHKFGADKCGATAVEFGLVAMMLILTIVFIMSIGMTIYYNQALDVATMKSARQIMLGNVQKASTAKDTFRTTYVCGNLPSIFNCNNVIVNVQTITEATYPAGYYALVNANQTALVVPSDNGSTQYSPGIQQSYEYVQVVYPITFLPTVVTYVLSAGAKFNGVPAVMIVSTAAFRNEQY